ncbi:MAG: 50S ribosomal protein L25 [Opitutales bacterium]|nr:50S ribosomal protein L25 [Opitutales bacterium]
MRKIQLAVEKRDCCGTTACGRLRKEEVIPAVVYGPSGVEPLQVLKPDFRKMMLEKGEGAALIELKGKSKTRLSLLQATQRNPRTDAYLHIDFREVDPKKPMVAKAPLKFVGDPVGVRDEGGVLDVVRHNVNVTCLPDDLPEYIEVNINDLHLEQTIHVKDLPQLKGVAYKTSLTELVVACVSVEEEEEAEQAAAGDAAATTAATPAAAAATPAEAAAPAADNQAAKK